MFGIFKMSNEKKAILASKNYISFRNINDKQIRKYSGTEITSTKISFTVQKVVLLLDAMYKYESFTGNFIYKDIAANKGLYEIVGNYYNTVLQNENYFPAYEKFLEHNNLIIDKLYKLLIGPDDTFRNKIHN